MNWMNRTLGLVLVVVMLLSMVACGKSDSPEGESLTENGAVSGMSGTDVEELPEDERFELSDDLYYGNGKNFTMLLRSNAARKLGMDEFYVGETLKAEHSVVEKAVYTREQQIEGRLGIAFNYFWCDTEDQLLDRYRREAGMQSFHISGLGMAMAPTLITEGLCTNWLDVPNVSLDKAWWYSRSGMAKDLTINNRLYLITGDASLMAQGKAHCIYANMVVLKDYGKIEISDLYAEVKAGKWTIDRLLEVTKGISTNVSGDSQWDEQDVYGYSFYRGGAPNDNYLAAFNIPILKLEGENYVIGLNCDETYTAVDKLKSLYYEDNRSYETTGKNDSISFFSSGHAAFTQGGFEWADQGFQNMSQDYGILPYPKLSELQESYLSTVGDVATVFIVPAGSPEKEFVGATMEALAYFSYHTTTPAYYETLLKVRSTRDTDSQEMLDLIHDTIKFDPGYVYNTDLGNPGFALRTLLQTDNKHFGNFSSFWTAMQGSYTKKLDTVLDYYYQ